MSVIIPPSVFWPAVFTSYAIPGILILNFVLLTTITVVRWKLSLFPMLGLLFGLPFILISYSNKGEIVQEEYNLSVLSFNAKLFRQRKTYTKFSYEAIKWAAADSSTIKCFQEYSSNSKWLPLNITKQIADVGYNHYHFVAPIEDNEHSKGLAIFSKLDILDSGIVWQNKESFNAGIYVDIQYQDDIIRIYNIHLESMGLNLYQYKNTDQYQSKLKALISKLKFGAEKRSIQIEKLIEHTSKCPYPYIICGDFNDTPYSYNYFKLKEFFTNSFEEAGNGFGFTFNSVLFFLRIDHQFFNSDFNVRNFEIDRSIKTSDHFPTRGFYTLN